MYVVYKVIIPSKLSMSQKRLIKELANTDLEDDLEFREFKKYISCMLRICLGSSISKK